MTRTAIPKYHQYASHPSTLPTVPKVRLYVDRHEREDDWFVNVGHVTDRGRWRTAPHAHPGYGQVIFVRNGRGVMNLDGSSVAFEGPCALLLPTECVHGLDYEVDVDRWVVTIEVSYLAQLNAKLREFIRLWSAPRVIAFSNAPEAAEAFYRHIQNLRHEVVTKAVGHVVATEALLTSLLLMLARDVDLDDAANEAVICHVASHEIRLAERFRELIDQHYRDNFPLQDYASILGVSLVQLRAACTAAAGQSPAKMIHARIVTEAKRNLIFGEMTMEQIAYSLGFSDAAYFTRFFRKEVGQAPSHFRLTARERQ